MRWRLLRVYNLTEVLGSQDRSKQNNFGGLRIKDLLLTYFRHTCSSLFSFRSYNYGPTFCFPHNFLYRRTYTYVLQRSRIQHIASHCSLYADLEAERAVPYPAWILTILSKSPLVADLQLYPLLLCPLLQ